MADLSTHLVADVDGMWWPCGCGADRDHDHPDVTATTNAVTA